MALTEAEKALLASATTDNRKAGFPYAPTEYWERESRNFEEEFCDKGIASFLQSQFNTRFHGVQKNDFRLYGWFLNLFHGLLQKRDTLGLLERIDRGVSDEDARTHQDLWNRSDKGTPLPVRGKLVYPDLLFSIYDFYNLYELCPAIATDPVVVGDLGAGYGRIGHVLVQANPRATYLVLDIPNSMLISSNTLAKLLPKVRIRTYQESRSPEQLTRDVFKSASVWILGSHDLRRAQRGAIDILVNVASFQEMTPPQANAYLRIFDQVIERGWVYVRNNAFSKLGLAGPNDYRIAQRWRERFSRPTSYSDSVIEAGFALE